MKKSSKCPPVDVPWTHENTKELFPFLQRAIRYVEGIVDGAKQMWLDYDEMEKGCRIETNTKEKVEDEEAEEEGKEERRRKTKNKRGS